MSATMDTRSVLAIVGGAVGVIGLWVTVLDFLEDRPDLSLTGQHIALRSELDLSSLSDQLNAIDELYGRVTHAFINGLLQSVLVLDEEDDQYAEDLETLLSEIQRAEDFFTGDPQPWRRDSIQYEDGVVTWPDS